MTWHENQAYGIAYGTTQANKGIRLYQSRDGVSFSTLTDGLVGTGFPNESGLAFLDDGTCLCLLRRDEEPRTGMLGRARPPYTSWSWHDLGVSIGGPQLLLLPDGRLVAGVRLYDHRVRTRSAGSNRNPGRFASFSVFPPEATRVIRGWSGMTGCSGSVTTRRTRARQASIWLA